MAEAVRVPLLSGGLLLLLWTLSKVSRVLIPFGIVYLLAYLVNPLVKHLEDRYRAYREELTLDLSEYSSS